VLRLNENKHFGAGFYIQKLLVLFCVLARPLNAQDTTQLNEVEIKASRLNSSSVGKKIQRLDSLTLELFKNQTVDVLLSNNTPIFVKNYGPGALQTTSFRGGNASQTAILWNGFNIQNTMLGLTDLSNVSANLFNSVDIEYGGASALWGGSGAMGGAVHLNNTHRFNKGFSTRLNTMYSDIGSRSASSNIGYSNSKLSAVVKAFIVKSDNTYLYYDKIDSVEKRQHKAAYDQVSLLPELKWNINSRHSVQTGAWINKGLRNIPNYSGIIANKVQQLDGSERVFANWNYSDHKLINYVRAAYFYEQLDYSDSLAQLDSKARTETRIAEDDLYWKWNNDHVSNIGLNYTKNEARINEYNGTKFIERYSVFGSHKDHFMAGKLTTNATVRLEHTSSDLNPFTYNFGADYLLFKNVTLKLNGGKVYRIPTLNDRYWIPSGNPDLKPEEGYTLDGTAEYAQTKNNYELKWSGCVFYKLISNWIQWIPYGVGGTKPVNLQEVYSRGSETSWHVAYVKKQFRVQLKCITSYVLSTVTKTELQNSDNIGKQLIYSPRYMINASLLINYRTFAIQYFHNYVGYRFTASDNSAWLKPYQTSTLRVNYLYSIKELDLGFFGNINNVFNKIYEVYENRPQPLRYFEIGVQLNYKKIKKQNI
jgi:vitamin B12 transporter